MDTPMEVSHRLSPGTSTISQSPLKTLLLSWHHNDIPGFHITRSNVTKRFALTYLACMSVFIDFLFDVRVLKDLNFNIFHYTK